MATPGHDADPLLDSNTPQQPECISDEIKLLRDVLSAIVLHILRLAVGVLALLACVIISCFTVTWFALLWLQTRHYLLLVAITRDCVQIHSVLQPQAENARVEKQQSGASHVEEPQALTTWANSATSALGPGNNSPETANAQQGKRDNDSFTAESELPSQDRTPGHGPRNKLFTRAPSPVSLGIHGKDQQVDNAVILSENIDPEFSHDDLQPGAEGTSQVLPNHSDQEANGTKAEVANTVERHHSCLPLRDAARNAKAIFPTSNRYTQEQLEEASRFASEATRGGQIRSQDVHRVRERLRGPPGPPPGFRGRRSFQISEHYRATEVVEVFPRPQKADGSIKQDQRSFEGHEMEGNSTDSVVQTQQHSNNLIDVDLKDISGDGHGNCGDACEISFEHGSSTFVAPRTRSRKPSQSGDAAFESLSVDRAGSKNGDHLIESQGTKGEGFRFSHRPYELPFVSKGRTPGMEDMVSEEEPSRNDVNDPSEPSLELDKDREKLHDADNVQIQKELDDVEGIHRRRDEKESKPASTGKTESRVKRKAARGALSIAWVDREAARLRVVGTWTLEGVQKLEETTKEYNERRLDLQSTMAGGQLNSDDAKAYPLLSAASLSAPKVRPEGALQELQRIKKTAASASETAPNAIDGTNAEIKKAIAGMDASRRLLQQAKNYHNNTNFVSNSENARNLRKEQGEKKLGRALELYRRKREALEAAHPEGLPQSMEAEFPRE